MDKIKFGTDGWRAVVGEDFTEENVVKVAKAAGKYIYDKEIGKLIDTATGEIFDAPQEGKKLAKQTVLRKLFSVIGVKYSSRQGGYTRIYRLPPRRGDASEMALIQLV